MSHITANNNNNNNHFALQIGVIHATAKYLGTPITSAQAALGHKKWGQDGCDQIRLPVPAQAALGHKKWGLKDVLDPQ